MAGLDAVRGGELIGRRLAGGRPVLGICVGMQVLFDRGIERGTDTEGLGEWPGLVDELTAPVLPHIGWNTVDAPADSVLFDGIRDERFYFVHSYAAREWTLEGHGAIRSPARHLGGARRAVRRRRRERTAVGDPVPPREVRRGGHPSARQLAASPCDDGSSARARTIGDSCVTEFNTASADPAAGRRRRRRQGRASHPG